MRAIIIDDSRAMRAILKRTMTNMGVEFSEAVDGIDALAKLETGVVPDVALVDWNMPNMNGYDLVCALRSDARYAAMKIIMVTTEVELEKISAVLEKGADEYVMKPFTEDVLQSKFELFGFTKAA